ncbi:uncharacterized protein DNG_00777 [Cephalotrichum gorgonifer]|uniref:GST N-terminal domain-containing protein n=1 Tax=Cephalotrichum gorgonifer TaxID=2041049 RepID=A0AAE8MPQ8_9PEZI|nr:uncharacterized protein DNG_00777 [Cephalotrichum gorgonifer]
MASSTGEGAAPIVLYHYPYSPYARRVVWYLALRGIPYMECIQPPFMPRPDVEALGVNYRRIPILTVGRDVYLDTRLIIQKLEALYPEKPRLGATSGGDQAIEQLLQSFNIDGGIFNHAFQLLPTDLPVLRDPVYYKDRAEFIGKSLTKESLGKGRPEAVNEMKKAFDLFEHMLLADGRDWVLGSDGPRVADIEAIWPYHWLAGIPGALPEETFSPSTYPRVYSWIDRFQKAVSAAKKTNGRAERISGEAALKLTAGSPWNEAPGSVDPQDSVVVADGLRGGDLVTVWPTDTGSSHRDTGSLVSISSTEVVIETRAKDNAATVLRVHAPRHGFRVRKTAGTTQTRL